MSRHNNKELYPFVISRSSMNSIDNVKIIEIIFLEATIL
jgi:hypothetical protein